MSEIEAAHVERENDWHVLSETWRKFEEESLVENRRLLVENKKLQNLAVPTTFQEPTMPVQVGKYYFHHTLQAKTVYLHHAWKGHGGSEDERKMEGKEGRERGKGKGEVL